MSTKRQSRIRDWSESIVVDKEIPCIQIFPNLFCEAFLTVKSKSESNFSISKNSKFWNTVHKVLG